MIKSLIAPKPQSNKNVAVDSQDPTALEFAFIK